MKTLNQILKNINFNLIQGSTTIPVPHITFDSRHVQPGSLFIAIKGTNTDGHKFIPNAINAGAKAVICSDCNNINYPDITIVSVNDTAQALAIAAKNFYDNPSSKISLVGVTGTNGKTTTATSLYNFFELYGQNAGLISTIRYLWHNMEMPASRTTPDPLTINMLLDKMLKANCKYAFMEVSSHALVQKRTLGLDFNGAIFTNITHDHLDYHGSFKNYLDAKKILFDTLPSNAFALVNADDKHAQYILQNTKARKFTFALKSHAHFKAKILERHLFGTLILLDNTEIWIQLLGTFNVYNILAVYATARLLGIDKTTALQIISKLKPIEGRFEVFSGLNRTAIVDYAHTPDALEKILTEINALKKPNQRIITVFGAGGNRDHKKRPLMGKIAAKLSDMVIITSDNPRFEDPIKIINDIKQGIENSKNVLQIPDRLEAIKTAFAISQPNDIILIAGKGHETYQEINGKKYYFDDRQIVKEIFSN